MSKWALSQNEARTLMDDIKDALEPVAKKHGLAFKFGNRGTITLTGFEAKIAMNKVTADGEDAEEVATFKRNAIFYNLRPEDQGTEFTYSGRKLKLVRINPRAKRWPFECESLDGDRGVRLPREAADIIRMATDKAKATA